MTAEHPSLLALSQFFLSYAHFPFSVILKKATGGKKSSFFSSKLIFRMKFVSINGNEIFRVEKIETDKAGDRRL